MSVPTTSPTPHTVEALLRVVQERDFEVFFLKLMVDKLALQLLRARRAQYGRADREKGACRLDGLGGLYCCGERRSRATSVGFAVGEAGQARPWKHRPVQGGQVTVESSALLTDAGVATTAVLGRFGLGRNCARAMLLFRQRRPPV